MSYAVICYELRISTKTNSLRMTENSSSTEFKEIKNLNNLLLFKFD